MNEQEKNLLWGMCVAWGVCGMFIVWMYIYFN